MKKAGKKFLM